MRKAIRNSILFLTIATVFVSTASVQAQTKSDDSAPRSRYRLVETVRKTSVAKERLSRVTEITRPTKRVAEPAFVPRSKKQVAPVQYPTSYSGPLGGAPATDENRNFVARTNAASIPSFDSATRSSSSATGLASYNYVPDPAVATPESLPNRPQFESAVPQPIQGPGVVAPLPSDVPQPLPFVQGQAVVESGAVQPSYSQPTYTQPTYTQPTYTQPTYNQPLDFQSTDFTSCAPSVSYSIFGVHEAECCDEWAGFCDCKPMDIPCACGGLKFNPGHFGRSWLKSKTDVCQDGGSCCLGKSKRGCKKGESCGCGKSSCDTGCSSGGCASSDCGCEATARQRRTTIPIITHKKDNAKCAKKGGLFANHGFFSGSKSDCGCDECQTVTAPVSSCGCDNCK